MSIPTDTESPTQEVSPLNYFYRTVWRWHFYAGLLVIPFMMILAITGSIYLFKPQLDALMYRDVLFVEPAAQVIPYQQQLQAVQQRYPNATITQVTPNAAPNRSTEVTFTAEEQKRIAFVNPYTAEILGERNETTNFQAIVRKIHGELMLGKVGDYIVELAACWGLVLILGSSRIAVVATRYGIESFSGDEPLQVEPKRS